MFVETIVLPGREWERWNERLRLLDDPPEALIASIAWDSGDGEVTGVSVWETPGAIADFFMERVGPFVGAEGEPPNKPQRHGEPLVFYLRP
jgi:hypothetical protein